MNEENFSTTLFVNHSPEAVFNAINDVHEWWGIPRNTVVTGETNKLGGEFTYLYKKNDEMRHFTKQKITDFIPDKKIVWDVTECNITSLTDTSEWVGTQICFELFEKDNGTELKFTHIGLVPDLECYNSCAVTWTRLMAENLKSFVEKMNKSISS